MTERPRRRFHVDIHVGADDAKELAFALRQIAEDIVDGRKNSTCGGPSSGWWYTVIENPEMTHERYMAEVHRYIEAIDAEKGTS